MIVNLFVLSMLSITHILYEISIYGANFTELNTAPVNSQTF